eukprot:724408-Karenia_brevis.AAC.1
MGARTGDEHMSVVAFMAWVALRLALQQAVIVHENVEGFDMDLLRDSLGEIYDIQTCVLDAVDFGWPVRRVRRYSVLTHKKKAFKLHRFDKAQGPLEPST